MSNIKLKNFAWVIISLAILTWVVLLFISDAGLVISVKSLYQVPKVISIDVLIWFVFIKWGWRWRIFKGWLVPFPDLSGNWKGEAIPKSLNPETMKPYDPVNLNIIIRQTFLFIHVRIYSDEMESNSYSSAFKLDAETAEVRLCYTYTSKPKSNIRDRSPIHDGTALLTVKTSVDKLEGEYWTNRATTGELYLKRSKK